MTQSDNEKSEVEQAAENLFHFAVDREDIKALVGLLSKEAKCKPTAVEYELQLLKIITTGWSISFFLEEYSIKDQLAEKFWGHIHEFAESLSETTGLMTGHDIQYFQILKSRLDLYVAALTEKPEMAEPAAIIGPEFAKVCGDIDDIYTVMTGSRMFIITVTRIKEYLESLDFQ